jgi:hypothetical protein
MLEKVAGFGLNTNMITYLTKKYHLSTVASQTMLFVWSAISNFAPIPGAVVADMYLGRFMAVALGSVACLIVSAQQRSEVHCLSSLSAKRGSFLKRHEVIASVSALASLHRGWSSCG